MKKIFDLLSEIEKTLFLPLQVRYLETKRKNGIIKDEKSVKIINNLLNQGFLLQKISETTKFIIAIRTQIFDKQIAILLKKYPKSIVVNLGCGLDTRYIKVDNGIVKWYDIDLPEVILLKRKYFSETERYHFIAKSILDFSWINFIEKDKQILFIAEGLLMYLTEDEVKDLFRVIEKHFDKAEGLFEVVDNYSVKHSNRHPELKKTKIRFTWGLSDSKKIEKWSKNIKVIEEWYCYDMLKRYRDRMIPFRIIYSIFPFFRNRIRVVHLKF